MNDMKKYVAHIRPTASGRMSTITDKPAREYLGAVDETRLRVMIAQHLRVRSRLPAQDQIELDQLAELVKKRLFAAPIRADLVVSATQIVSRIVPGLTKADAMGLAEYVLGRIAGGGVIGSSADRSFGLMSATKSMQETQMSFNLQYLQLQSQMQNENRAYTAVSNIMKSKKDTVANSINNLR